MSTFQQSLGSSAQVRDISGYPIFSAGEAGAAHVMAHRMLDQGRPDLGHRLLGEWLEGRNGSGSDWVHLQWHMAVFELEQGLWDSAFARFREHILPVASTTHEALTDGPSMLWRLSLASDGPVELPWEAVRESALERMGHPSPPFVELHNLLALAGAGDVESLDRWLRQRSATSGPAVADLVERTGAALLCWTRREYREAAAMLSRLVPYLLQMEGGSRAQLDLFERIRRACPREAARVDAAPFHRIREKAA